MTYIIWLWVVPGVFTILFCLWSTRTEYQSLGECLRDLDFDFWARTIFAGVIYPFVIWVLYDIHIKRLIKERKKS